MNHEQIPQPDTGAKTEKINLTPAKVQAGFQMAQLAKAMARVQFETPNTADGDKKTESDFSDVLPHVIKSERPLSATDLAEVWIKLSIVKNNREKIKEHEQAIADLSSRIASATNDAEKQTLIAQQYRHTTEAAILRKDTFTTVQIVKAKGVSDIAGTMQALEKSGIF